MKLFFLSLSTPDAIARVANRVRQGGHDETYRKLVTYWQWLDNNGVRPKLIEEGTNL